MLLLAAVLVFVSTSGAHGTACPSHCDCGAPLEPTCELADGGSLLLRVRPSHSLNIYCEDGAFKCADLPPLPWTQNTTLPILGINDCLLANELITCILESIGADGLDSLVLKRIPTESEVIAALDEKNIKGLQGLRSLTIEGDSFEKTNETFLPTEILAYVPELVRLTIRNVKLGLLEDNFLLLPKLEYLELSMDALESIPKGTFRGLKKLQILALWGNELSNLTAGTFIDLESLEKLDLSSNKLKALQARIFMHSRNLRTIRIINNKLESIDKMWADGLTQLEELEMIDNDGELYIADGALGGLPALRALRMQRCGLVMLPEGTFFGSSSIRNLSLPHNHLTELPIELFRDQHELRLLDLSYNSIATLTSQHFASLKKLELLNLDGNLMTRLPELLFSGMVNLKGLRINDNKLTDIAANAFVDSNALETLELARNALSLRGRAAGDHLGLGTYDELGAQSPLNALYRLRRLDLSHNQISIIFTEWRIIMLNLQYLNLSHNVIPMLTDADMNFLQSDILIDLRHNNISTTLLSELPHEQAITEKSSTKGPRMLLDDNPFVCDCQLYALTQRLAGLRPATSEPMVLASNAVCAAPHALSGRALHAVPPSALTCEVPPPTCPARCACIVRPSRSVLELNCSEPPSPQHIPMLEGLHVALRLQRLPHSLAELSLPSNVYTLNISALNLTQVPSGLVPRSLKLLDLSKNKLTSIPIDILSSVNLHLKLADNPFACDCEHWESVDRLQRVTDRIVDLPSCENGGDLRLVDALRLCDARMAAMAGGALALLGLLVATLAFLHYRYGHEIRVILYARGCCRCLFREEALDRDKLYDAFVSFSQLDEKFVLEELVPRLENAPESFRLCLHHRDWIAGEYIGEQIARSVAQSRRTIVVLSRNFLQSVWGRLEFRAAHVAALREKRARVVVLLLEDAAATDDALDEELRAYLATNTYVRRADPLCWDKLRFALPRRTARGVNNLKLVPHLTLQRDSLKDCVAA